MKMVAFSCGKQCAIHGPAVNVPTDLTPVCTLLPRLLSQSTPDDSYEALEMNNDWLSDAVAICMMMLTMHQLSTAHAQPPLSPAVTITASSHGEHFMHDYM